jgi:transposase, IS30 family
LSVESIYQAIYDPAVALTRPARRRRRRRRLRGLQRRGRLTAMRMIAERPVEAQDRRQAGHWEGDLIMGPGNRSAIGTLIERRAPRYVILIGFPEAIPTAQSVRAGIEAAFARLPAAMRRTLTWDQGDAHAPWQRGSNENLNGRLRDYFPKGTDLSVHSAEAIAAVAATLNARPRKTLGWKTPAEAFDKLLRSANEHHVATTT